MKVLTTNQGTIRGIKRIDVSGNGFFYFDNGLVIPHSKIVEITEE